MTNELYDRTETKSDLPNLAGDPQYSDIKTEMQQAVEKWMKSLSAGRQY